MKTAKSPYRLNMQAAWDRNIDPALKVASVCATFGRDSLQPAHVELRLFFWNDGHARRWLEQYSARYVGGRLFPLYCRNGNDRGQMISQYKVHIDLSTKLPQAIVSDIGARKYCRIMSGIKAAEYKVDWQTPHYIPRLYETREALELAMKDGGT